MNLLKKLSVFILLIVAISSCNVDNGLIQKRKYKKGYHLSLKKNIKKSDSFEQAENIQNEKENVAQNNSKKEISNTDLDNTAEVSSFNNEVDLKNETIDNSYKTEPTQKHFTLKSTIKSLNNKVKNTVEAKSIVHSNTASKSSPNDGDMLILLYVLAVLIPFVAVGIVTDWDVTDVLINLLLCILCYIPGVIHAFIKIRDNY